MRPGIAIKGALLSLVFLAIFAYAVCGLNFFIKNFSAQKNAPAGLKNAAQQNAQPTKEQPLQADVNSQAAISVQTNLLSQSKVFYEKNSNQRLPIASLTKLMTAVVVLDNYDLSQKVEVSETAGSQAPMKQDVNAGDVLPAESLFDLMIVKSSNKAAFALAEIMGTEKFVEEMNKKAKDFGMQDTVFLDPTGISPENVSTASDLAKLAEIILKKYPKISEVSKVKELFVPGFGKVESTDQLLGEVPEIICGKTGFTNQAKGCLLLVVNNPQNNNYSINVILGADDRFQEMKKLIQCLQF